MLDLKIYGVPSVKYDALIDAVGKTITQRKLNLNIQEVYDVSILIKDGIEKIPTIRLKNHLNMVLEDAMDFDHFVDMVIEKIEAIPDEVFTRKLLVPVDFSAASDNALKYAKLLAVALKANLEIVHIYHPGVTATGHGQIALSYTMEDAQERMNTLVGTNNPKIKGSIIQGFATKEIINMSSDYDLIVMGNSGEGNSLQKLFGTTAQSIGTNSRCPVLFIPNNYKAKVPSTAMYAVNDDIRYFNMISCILRSLKMKLEFFHINDDPAHKAIESDYCEKLTTIREQYPEIEITEKSLFNPDIHEGIETLVRAENPDILIMEKSNPTLFQKMFSTSQTKNAIESLNIPVIILHHKDKMCKCGGICKKAPKDQCDH